MLKNEARSPLVLLLVLSLILVAVLAAQAQMAASSHRYLAEKVLRDYAALAADEFTRRAQTEIGYAGYYSVITALRETPRGTELPAPGDLAPRAGEEARRAFALAHTFFRYDTASGNLETSGLALEPEVRAWLEETLRARGLAPLAAGRRYEVRYARVGGKLQGVVDVPLESVVVGFTVDPAALAAALKRPLERAPLLPPSLAGPEVARDAVYLSLADPFGGELVRAGAPYSPFLGVEKKLGSDYNGVLDGFVLRAAIDPRAAPRLAIGGLPRSRLPVLLGLLALTAGLLLTAMVQLRKERALSRLRTDFVSRVSHELRTPLTQIRMFAETLLLDRIRSEDERRRSLAIIDREARRLSNLVENVLHFSRGERGEVRIAPRPHDLGPYLRELLDEFRPLAEGGGARLAMSIPEHAVASVDDDALRRVLLNLLDNAVKYGPRGQEVRVGASNGSSGLRIWVDDEGPGIPKGDRERIWERFHRLEEHRRSAIAGTGIGLAVVRDLVGLHGGRAWVEPGERNGSRFVVEFPP